MSSTGLPVFSDTFSYRTRAPLASSWLKWTLWSWVAVYAFTGTLTKPKLMAPDQIDRAISFLYPKVTAATRTRRRRSGRPGEDGMLLEADRPRPSRGGSAMAWDFETEPEFQAKLDWA